MYDDHTRRKRARGEPGWFSADESTRVVAELAARLKLAKLTGGRILEVGCGAGEVSLGLACLGYEVTGVDISPAAIEWAWDRSRAMGLEVRFMVGDVRDAPFLPSTAFDAVVDGSCLHFVCEGREAFLATIHRVLRPGGVFIVRTVCGEPEAHPGIEFDSLRRVQVVDGAAVTYFGEPEAVESELRAAGFEVSGSELAPAVSGVRCAMLHATARRPPHPCGS